MNPLTDLQYVDSYENKGTLKSNQGDRETVRTYFLDDLDLESEGYVNESSKDNLADEYEQMYR